MGWGRVAQSIPGGPVCSVRHTYGVRTYCRTVIIPNYSEIGIEQSVQKRSEMVGVYVRNRNLLRKIYSPVEKREHHSQNTLRASRSSMGIRRTLSSFLENLAGSRNDAVARLLTAAFVVLNGIERLKWSSITHPLVS